MAVAQIIVNTLNDVGLAARGKARFNMAGNDQRDGIIYASTVDLEEAYQLGQRAARIALEKGTGLMSSLVREPGTEYRARYMEAPLEQMANSEREFPRRWIAPNRIDVTDDFVRYAQPLIGSGWPDVPLVNGLQRFTRLERTFVPQRLPGYVPEALRG
jgi:6-phosphofructokinase 1